MVVSSFFFAKISLFYITSITFIALPLNFAIPKDKNTIRQYTISNKKNMASNKNPELKCRYLWFGIFLSIAKIIIFSAKYLMASTLCMIILLNLFTNTIWHLSHLPPNITNTINISKQSDFNISPFPHLSA